MDARILVVDDDRLLLEVVGDFLRDSGYEVDVAENASIALAKFNPGKYRLAILDMVLPGMSGLELMNRLMNLDKHLFCLIMTGFANLESAYEAMVEDSSDYIIKPFHLLELLNVVQRHF